MQKTQPGQWLAENKLKPQTQDDITHARIQALPFRPDLETLGKWHDEIVDAMDKATHEGDPGMEKAYYVLDGHMTSIYYAYESLGVVDGENEGDKRLLHYLNVYQSSFHYAQTHGLNFDQKYHLAARWHFLSLYYNWCLNQFSHDSQHAPMCKWYTAMSEGDRRRIGLTSNGDCVAIDRKTEDLIYSALYQAGGMIADIDHLVKDPDFIRWAIADSGVTAGS